MMRARTRPSPATPLLVALLAGLVACGGTYGGLGEEPGADSARGEEDGVADALFGVDDGGDIDAPDTAHAPDVADTSVAPDSDGADAADGLVAPDTTDVPDTVVVGDTADVPDTAVVGDTADVPDTVVVGDTADVPDTVVVADAADAADAADTAPPPILSTNPGRVYCEAGSVDNALCPAGQKCCGTKAPLAGWDWSCTGGSCDAPFLGDARTYVCNERADCGGFYCCVDRNFWGNMVGTKCHGDTSPCGDETACMLDSDCPGGKKCKQATGENASFSLGMCG